MNIPIFTVVLALLSIINTQEASFCREYLASLRAMSQVDRAECTLAAK
jgi:hypothetical protein